MYFYMNGVFWFMETQQLQDKMRNQEPTKSSTDSEQPPSFSQFQSLSFTEGLEGVTEKASRWQRRRFSAACLHTGPTDSLRGPVNKSSLPSLTSFCLTGSDVMRTKLLYSCLRNSCGQRGLCPSSSQQIKDQEKMSLIKCVIHNSGLTSGL